MTEQEKRARFFAKTGRIATSETVEYQAFSWGIEYGAEKEREACAELLEHQRYMTLQPLKTYTATECWQNVRDSVKYLAGLIRRRGCSLCAPSEGAK